MFFFFFFAYMKDWQAWAMALNAKYYSTLKWEIEPVSLFIYSKAATQHRLLKRNPESLRKQQFQGSLVPY